MKTTKNNVDNDTTLFSSQSIPNNTISEHFEIARPLRSLRPMKSMVRVKSLKPKKVELAQSKGLSRKRVIKL